MRRLAGAIGLALLLALATAAAAQAGTWTLEHRRLLHVYSSSHDIAALGAQDAWALDGDGKLLRRDASGWKRSRSITPGVLARGLDGAAWGFGSSRNEVHAWSFDGAAWRDRAFRARDALVLDGAAIADNDAWLAYSQQGETRPRRRLIHWDGAAWRTVRTPLPVSRLAATAPNDVWATADQVFGTPAQPGILHWNGTAWTRTPTPSIALPKPFTTTAQGQRMTFKAIAEINDIAALSATDAWAVGNVITRLCCDERRYGRSIVLHWDGTSWKRVDPGVRGVELRAVSVDPVGGVWIAANRGRRPQLLNFRGAGWTRVNLPRRPREDAVGINAIAAVPGSAEVLVFAENGLRAPIGDQDNENLIYRYAP